MIRLFRKKPPANPFFVDIHSHLLPGLDDGVKSLEESLNILKWFENAGYKKVITTPHIMSDYYKNTPEIILESLKNLRSFIAGKTEIRIEAAAEYYLDETFIELLTKGKEALLCIGDDYVLVETSFMNEPIFLKEAIFKIQSSGLKPLLAHPERYMYLQANWSLVQDLIDRGTFFQLNINSLVGFYSKPVQKMAMKLLKNNMIHFLGSDCHNLHHIEVTQNAFRSTEFRIASRLSFLNNTLL